MSALDLDAQPIDSGSLALIANARDAQEEARRKAQSDALLVQQRQAELAAHQAAQEQQQTAQTMATDATKWALSPSYAGKSFDQAPEEAKAHFIDAYGNSAAQAPKVWNDAQTAVTGVATGVPIQAPTASQVAAGTKAGVPYEKGMTAADYSAAVTSKQQQPQFDDFTTPQQATDSLESQQHGMGSVAQQIANYQLPATILGRYPANQKSAILNAVQVINPEYQATEYGARQKAKNDFATGPQGTNITSANTVVGHLQTLADAAEQLHNSNFTPWNTVANAASSATGNPQVVRFETARNAVASELAKMFKGGTAAPTTEEIKEFANVINPSMSPEQIKTAIGQLVNLMGSRLDALQDQWKQTVKSPRDIPFLTPKSRAILRKLGQNPDEIDNPAKQTAATTAPPPPRAAVTPAIPTVNSQAEYDALPSGSRYTDSQGRTATKR